VKQAKATIALKMLPNALPKQVFQKKLMPFQSHPKSIQNFIFHQKFFESLFSSLEKRHKSQSGLHLQTCATQEKVRPIKTPFNWRFLI
jgi:hypothetical protein